MSFAGYLTGVVGLAVVAASLGLAAIRLRGLLLPGWDGAPARLAEAVLALSALTVLLQALGAVGLFEPALIVGASIAIGAAAAIWVRPAVAGGEDEPPPAPAISKLQLALALAAAAFLAAHWATGLQDVWARGMLTFDTLWYHGPFAARIAESGSAWGLHFTDPLYLNWFYPQNSELVHAAGISLFDRDLISPLVNFGWLGVGLLAAWCIGRPYGVAPLALVAAALVLDTGPMVPREAGTPANDVAPVALLLAAAALLVNAWAGRVRELSWRSPALGALLVAGLAMGLALGTKLTIAAGVAAMAAGVPLIVPPGFRRRATLVFLAGVAATAGFWFLRNLIHSGNPLPWLQDAGPVDLPGPDRGLEGRDNYNVAHYILQTPDTEVWSSFFYKAITNLFGPAWPLFFGLAAAGAGLAIWRPRSLALRLLGVVTVVSAVAYLFTPLTAAGPQDQPLAFGINLRYLIPALALGLAMLPLEPKLAPERWRLALLAGGCVALVVTALYSDSAYIWEEPHASIPVAALIGIALVGVPVGLAALARKGIVPLAAAGALALIAVAAVGWERQDDYLDARYTNADDFRFELAAAADWAKETQGENVGVAGLSGAYNQYLFYGDRLSNRVQYVGRSEPAGDFRAIDRCAEFVEAVDAGGYDYVVTTPELDLNDPGTAQVSPEGGWLRRISGAEQVLRDARVAVFRIEGPLDPAGCRTSAAGVPSAQAK